MTVTTTSRVEGADARPPLVERRYDDGESTYDAHVDAQGDVHIVVRGRGTMRGVHDMIDFFAAAEKAVSGRPTRIYYDLSSVRGVPLRAQLVFGKWFLAHRQFVRRAAIVGAGPVERRLAAAVCAIARIDKVRFFEREAEGRAWLLSEEGPA